MVSGVSLQVLVALLATGSTMGGPTDPGTCEPIKVDMCKHIGYNFTGWLSHGVFGSMIHNELTFGLFHCSYAKSCRSHTPS